MPRSAKTKLTSPVHRHVCNTHHPSHATVMHTASTASNSITPQSAHAGSRANPIALSTLTPATCAGFDKIRVRACIRTKFTPETTPSIPTPLKVLTRPVTLQQAHLCHATSTTKHLSHAGLLCKSKQTQHMRRPLRNHALRHKLLGHCALRDPKESTQHPALPLKRCRHAHQARTRRQHMCWLRATPDVTIVTPHMACGSTHVPPSGRAPNSSSQQVCKDTAGACPRCKP